MTGKVIPVKLKPAPLGVIWEIVSNDSPVFISVSERLELPPLITFPKLRFVGLAASWPGVRPVPARGTLSAAFDAFDVMARLPLTALPVVGAKVTLKLTLWPALTLSGTLKPLALKPVPVALAAEIVTLEPPELVSVSVIVRELPTCTLPKARLDGDGVSWPDVIPVPDTGNMTVFVMPRPCLRPDKVLNEIDTTLLLLPDDWGANVTCPVTLCPPARVTG